MSSIQIAGQNTRTQTMALLDPTGKALGTAEAPLQTATSALQTTSDLTKLVQAPIVAAGTVTLVTAAAGARTRVYRMRVDVAGANVVTFTDASGSERMTFAGAGFRILDFATRPWFVTAVNTAFTVTTTAATELNIVIEYTRVP